MSNKSSGGRGKRPEKEGGSSDQKPEAERPKGESKGGETSGKSSRSQERSHHGQGRPDRSDGRFHSGRDSKGPPMARNRDKDERGGGWKKREWSDKIERGSHRGGRIDLSGHRTLGASGDSSRRDDRASRDRDYSDKKSEGKAFADDSRISKLVRKATRDDDRDRRLNAVRQLKEFLVMPENAKAVSRVADNLMYSLQDIFYERTYKEVKEEAARCLGIAGSCMGGDAQRFFQWLFGKLNTAQTDEMKILLLTALLQALEHDDANQHLSTFIPIVMTNCQSVLENADVPELLIAVVDVILHVTNTYPHVFGAHFKDTVDILVGWHIDSTQKDSLTEYTSRALITFHQFWVSDMNFSMTLLGQFLEDMEAYAEDLSLGLQGQHVADDEVPTPQECIIKIAALLKVFTTVLQSLGDHFTPGGSPTITLDYMLKMLERIVHCVESATHEQYCESVLIVANKCVQLIVTNLGADISHAFDIALPYLSNQLESTSTTPSYPYIISLMTVLTQVIDQVNTQLPTSFIASVLGDTSILLKVRFSQNPEVKKHIMRVIQSVMGLKSVPLLEEAYRHILGDLQIAICALLKRVDSDEQCSLVSDSPYEGRVYSPLQAEVVILFDVCALAEVGNTKNNLIGMWALSPSIFEMFARHLVPVCRDLMVQYPSVLYAILRALYTHCSRHGHFMSSSSLVVLHSTREGSVLANVSSTNSGHFSAVLSFIADLLSSQSTPLDSRILCIHWTTEIFTALQSSQHVFKTKHCDSIVDALINLGYSDENEACLLSCQCLQNFIKINKECSSSMLKKCVDMCTQRINDVNNSLREAYSDLLMLIPADISASWLLGPVQRGDHVPEPSCRDLQSVWYARRNHVAKQPTGTFHSHDFRTVMGYILYGKKNGKKHDLDEWLEKVFHSCQRTESAGSQDRRADDLSRRSLLSSSQSQLWFWATWEVAQFCVLTKLRTPLGKPQETFTTIEGFLKQFAAEARSHEADEEKLTTEDANEGDSDKGVRVWLLLQFMEHLEKSLHNAYSGCALAISVAPKAARTFFRTNRNTCQEWLMRVRLSVIIIALHCGQPALAVRHAFELIRDMKDTNSMNLQEFDHVVMYAVRALCELRCPEAIQGLYIWCKDTAGKRLTWIKAAIDKAAGKYESAVNDFKSTLRNLLVSDKEDETAEKKLLALVGEGESVPTGSPRQINGMDSVQKLSILSKNSTVSDSTPDPVIANYLVEEVSQCYMNLNDWEEVLNWQETIQQYRSEHAGSPLQKAFYTTDDINFIKALFEFEDQEFHKVEKHLELVPGFSAKDDKTDKVWSKMWDRKQLTHQAHVQLIRAITLSGTSKDVQQDMSKIQQHLDNCSSLCSDVLKIGALDWPYRLDQQATLLMSTARVLKKLFVASPETDLMPFSNMWLNAHEHSVPVGMEMLRLFHTQVAVHDIMSPETGIDYDVALSNLRTGVARLARKTSNFALAEHLMFEEAMEIMSVNELENLTNFNSLTSMLESVRAANGVLSQQHLLKIERETAKLLKDQGNTRFAIETLLVSSANHGKNLKQSIAVQLKNDQSNVLIGENNARSLLSVTQWLQTDYKHLSILTSQLKLLRSGEQAGVSISASQLHLLEDLEINWDASANDITIESNPVAGDSEMILGRLLHLATLQAPNLAKSWFSLAGWCYKLGRKAVDSASHGSVELSTDEKAAVLELLPRGTSNDETEQVLNIISQVHAGMSSDEDISDQDQWLYDEGAETTRRQLLSSCLSLQIASDDCIDRLLDIWRKVVHQVYSYYQLSAKAYFTYLKLNAQASDDLSNMDGNVTATLRVLRLLVKHAWELRDVLEDGLAHTPTAPWKGIIPQLFSRLNHPEAYVRQSVSDLLCRVAQDAPHLIVYPAVVGCSSGKNNSSGSGNDGFLNEYLSQNEDADKELGDEAVNSQEGDADGMQADDAENTILQDCFQAIVDTLAMHNPRMISEVQLLVGELRRITLLWDELWLGTLMQHHQDVNRRLIQLESEVKKTQNNPDLSKEEKTKLIRQKHATVLKPTVYTLKQVQSITSRPAETVHEQWFQDTYGKMIEEAMEKIENPTNPNNPHSSWTGFKQLHRSLQERAQKRTSLVLAMKEISDKLANLSNTVIAMPGISASGQVVTIASIHNTVQILPTKTKPKKLVIMGSDGNRYSYLFKGLEDLHLDERIMQFLSIVNNMFAKANREEKGLYQARHYSVTPLGERSGLIQWVEGATPLFSLYKRWQQREALAQQLKQQQMQPNPQTSNNNSNPANVPRPSEVYYNKLTPALREEGYSMDNRKEWPLPVMRKVLQELMDETPSDLLAKELWCMSTGAGEWWQITQTYARSTAVMSMIGYIIGLGDRHLDNVLVDLATGEVVHIDYNVCFEKGKSLRVPEKVPFRMTQNLQTALGVTGVQGTFKIACEHVIKTMRKGRETLLTLLEAFVYDPLVDWTTGNEGGYTGAFYGGGQAALTNPQQSKKDLERSITYNMFSIRISEMKTAWLKNRDDMQQCLPKLQKSVEDQLQAGQEQVRGGAKVQELKNQKEYLLLGQEDKSHHLHSLPSRYEEFAIVKKTRQEVEAAIQEKLNECEHWHQAHEYALGAVQGGRLTAMVSQVTTPLNSITTSGFASVTEFLQGAGQVQLVQQCEEVETELTRVVQQRRVVLHTCLDVLHTYASIIGQMNTRYVHDNRNKRWQGWLHDFICSFTHQKCTEILTEFQELYGLTTVPHPATPVLLSTEAKLHKILSETEAKLYKLLERRKLEGVETSLLSLHVKEVTMAVHHFVKENGKYGMASVLVTALANMSKRYVIMEGAAAAARDRLMDLTSREGDWFLDELCSMSGNVGHLVGLLNDIWMEENDTQGRQEMMQVMQTTHAVYLSLQDLNINFCTIIVPEAMKTIQQGETSICRTLESLNQIIGMANQPLDNLLSQLDIQLRNAILEMQQTEEDSLLTVRQMRQSFNLLLQGSDLDPCALTPGQMLLMGFNGLFTQLDADFSALLDAMSRLDIPENWKKVDIVKEARSLQMTAFNENTIGILSCLFFVRQLKAMQEFFGLCTQNAASLQELTGGNISEEELLTRPVKHFIAEYVRKHMIGLSSQLLGNFLCVYIQSLGIDVTAEIELKDIGAESKVSLEDLSKKVIEVNLKNGLFQQHHLTMSSSLISDSDSAWRKHDLARRLDHLVNIQQNRLKRADQQLARFQWLHEDVFVKAGKPLAQMIMPARGTVMQELRKAVQTLVTQETTVTAIQERHQQLEASITQRLKWAAGANPSLSSVMMQYEESLTVKNALLQTDSTISNEVITICNAILHLEALRTRTPEAMSADTNFLSLLNRCDECCLLIDSCSSPVSPIEESLITLQNLPLNEGVTEEWIKSANQSLDQQISAANAQTKVLKENVDTAKEGVKTQVTGLRSVLASHHKLMSDIRSILKSMAKHEEQEDGKKPAAGGVRDYVNQYKTFSENFTAVLKLVLTDEVTADIYEQVKDTLGMLAEQIEIIYVRLVDFAPALSEVDGGNEVSSASALPGKGKNPNDTAVSPTKKPSLLRSDAMDASPSLASPATSHLKPQGAAAAKRPDKVSRDPRTGKAVQERNAYAIGVWRRVKLKLDGRDPDANKRFSVAEQVDYTIKEATDLDNLSVLYEGWTPWV